MRKLTIVLIIGLCSVAFAVTQITYNVPDDYGKELLAALIAQSDAHVHITIQGSQGAIDPNEEDYQCSIDFRTPPYDPNVPAAVFVKRRVAMFTDALKVAHERKLQEDIQREYYHHAPEVDVNEPDPNNMG